MSVSVRPKQRPTTTKAGVKNRFEVHRDNIQKHFDLFGRDNPFAATHAAISRAGGPKYTGFRDTIDGGGPGMSGAMFSSRDLRGLGYSDDNYISQAEFDAMRDVDPNFNQGIYTGIGGFSNNMLGMRPLGSYAQERALGPAGTNIGLDRGLFGFMNKGGVSGALLNLFGKGQMNPDEEMYSSQGAVETPALAEGGLMALRYYLGGLV
tara:strand:- start:241 stop:861 length:621 start_codon:yes stop_codon:yes gene_type:complete